MNKKRETIIHKKHTLLLSEKCDQSVWSDIENIFFIFSLIHFRLKIDIKFWFWWNWLNRLEIHKMSFNIDLFVTFLSFIFHWMREKKTERRRKKKTECVARRIHGNRLGQVCMRRSIKSYAKNLPSLVVSIAARYFTTLTNVFVLFAFGAKN